MRWCCGVFKGWFDQAGQRGFGIVVARLADGQGTFRLQHRAIDKGDPVPSSYPHPLTLVSEAGIQFCPWCGLNLQEVYGRHFDHLIRDPN